MRFGATVAPNPGSAGAAARVTFRGDARLWGAGDPRADWMPERTAASVEINLKSAALSPVSCTTAVGYGALLANAY